MENFSSAVAASGGGGGEGELINKLNLLHDDKEESSNSDDDDDDNGINIQFGPAGDNTCTTTTILSHHNIDKKEQEIIKLHEEQLEETGQKQEEEMIKFLSLDDTLSEIITGLVSEDFESQEEALKKADLFILNDAAAPPVTEDEDQEEHDVDNNWEDVDPADNTDNSTDNNKDNSDTGDDGAFPSWIAADILAEGDFLRIGQKSTTKDKEQNEEETTGTDKEYLMKQRKTWSDQYRKAGNDAFCKQNYAEALENYNRAINLVKTSPTLYNNRALTYLRIGLYTAAVADTDLAIYCADASLKAHLIKAKAYFLAQKSSDCHEWLDFTKTKFPALVDVIEHFKKQLFNLQFLETELQLKKEFKSTTSMDPRELVRQPDLVWKMAARHQILPNPMLHFEPPTATASSSSALPTVPTLKSSLSTSATNTDD